MSRAYVDTSCLIAIAFEEKDAASLARRIASFDTLVSSNLLEAEFFAASARNAREPDPTNLARIRWIYPDRSLRPEITRVLAKGYVRGAGCWHIATALYIAEGPSTMSFLTLDSRQRRIAHDLGFAE